MSALLGLTPYAGPDGANPQLVGGTDVAYHDDTGTLYRKAFDGTTSRVIRPCNGLFAYAWNRDGTKAAYLTNSADFGGQSQLHLIADGRDRSIDFMRAVLISGCVAPCDEWAEIRVLFSPDGRYVSLLSYWTTPLVRIWTLDGQVVKDVEGDDPGAPQAGPTMSLWSGDGFFWRDSKGVEVWRNGVQSLAIPAIRWLWPRAAPADPRIVYTVKDGAGVPSVFVFDSHGGQSKMLMRFRSHPVFLNSRFLWFRGERSCTSGDPYPCGLVATLATGKTYVYDLSTGTESESIISDVWDVWPHSA